MSLTLGPARALRESIAYILRDREERNLKPFEVVYSVELSEDYEKIRETVGSMQEVGVTWVLESIHGIRYSCGQAVKRILKGPPVVS